jgi:pimeloyl-ACP methyl ester carboxylesterase
VVDEAVENPATFVLIHGGLRGGWAWKAVARELRKRGHEAYHPSLDGCGERKGAAREHITLDTHGREVADLLFYEDLSNVILVGTSLGGMVIARAAELARERIARLVFISAVCPLPGESVFEANGVPRPDFNPFSPPRDNLDKPGSAAGFLDLDPAQRAWARARFTAHPFAAAADPVDLRQFWSQKWNVDVLRCTQVTQPPESHQRRTAEKLGGSYAEIDSGHNVALAHPDKVADYLVALAAK